MDLKLLAVGLCLGLHPFFVDVLFSQFTSIQEVRKSIFILVGSYVSQQAFQHLFHLHNAAV
jgi:hypothetical protein